MLRLKQTLKSSKQIWNLAQTSQSLTIHNYSYRTFALFGAKSQSENRNQYSNLESQRTQEEILKSIDTYKNNIKKKTEQGFGLSKSISESVEQDKFKKLQRYEIFIDKMHTLYKSEIRFNNKQRKQFQAQKSSILYSLTPLKDILRIYNDLTVRGFNSEATIKTLETVSKVLRARGYKARVYTDYSINELDQSWRMQKLVDDIKFGLRQDQFYSPAHLAETCQWLGDLGYKNTELIPLIFEKLQTQLKERQVGRQEPTELNFNDAVYGGPKNFIPRHYVFKGFQNSDEFNEYLKILLQWENENKEHFRDYSNKEAVEIEKTMNDIINAAVQVKELQKDYQGSIENLRQQYFMMLEATDKNQFLQENKYIYYDLLELQELLVKGGYLEPGEANRHLAKEPFDKKMERASEVFYDYVLNYAPELLSPQHSNFYEAAVKSTPKPKDVSGSLLKEFQNVLNLETLSSALVGLSEQALSFRRDTVGKDYLNKFYEDYLMPNERKVYNMGEKGNETVRAETILMERSYLKAWQIFKEQTAQIIPRLRQLVSEDKSSLVGQLQALNALGACRVDEPELRKQIVDNALELINKKEFTLSSKQILSGLKGLALAPSIDDKCKELAQKLSSRFEGSNLTFTQQVDGLWSLCALQQYESGSLKGLLKTFNKLRFDRLDHEIKFDEFCKLIDIHNALRIEAPKGPQITNKALLIGINGQDMYFAMRYNENNTKYDPFKDRVVQALAKGLTDASIEHQLLMENELLQAQRFDTEALNPEKYPYKPDVLMGYKGQKVGVFVLPETLSTRDTHKATGDQQFKMRLLQNANNGLQVSAIAVDDVVKYDIEKMKIDYNQNFNFSQTIESQIKIEETLQMPDFTDLAKFGAALTELAPTFIDTIKLDKDLQKMDSVIRKLYQIFQTKQQVELRLEKEHKMAGYDDLKFQILKLHLMIDTLSPACKQQLQQVEVNLGTLKQKLINIAEKLPQNTSTLDNTPKGISKNWMGTRMEVELPVSQQNAGKIQKSIAPEMINQKFMWVEDYFHYDDWKLKQKQCFDNFNLLVIPPNEDAPKFFFDKENNRRRIPQGIFPYPNHKRQIMLPAQNKAALDLSRNSLHDEFVLYEKEPFKLMVIKELENAETLKSIDAEVSMITNLQNIKQGLKSDYSDKEILNVILLNLGFTDQLIEEHLEINKKQTSDPNKKPRFVTRDSSQFRKFVESTYFSKDREDPFTHFYLKEGAKKEKIYKLLEEEKQVQYEVEENSLSQNVVEQGEQRREVLQDKIDKMLLEMDMENHDYLNVTDSLKTNIKVNYDLNTLVKSESVYDVDPDLIDTNLSDEDYLNLTRRRAESKLIKMKIIYKLHQGDKDLTQNEKLYLKKWLQDIKQRNLLSLRDSMLPKTPSSLTIGDIEAKCIFNLNSIARVQIERDAHKDFALNDLVVEISHFLDEEVVNKVETEIFSEKMKKEWKLGKDFKAVETRNKEIGLVLNELEEVAWRSAGMFTDKDFENLKRMFSVKRNKDFFDRQFYEQDMRSFKQFADACNTYDDRISKLEKWVVRKEDEIKQRVNLPPEHLKKSDQELFAKIDAPLKRARERLVSKFLVADQYGNKIEKEYKDLTSRELHDLSENLSLRLYLFNYEYPKFIPQAVKAVMEHPNLLKSDKDHLDAYCKIFELDWRGDQTYQNKQDFLFNTPIYLDGSNIKAYGELTNDVVKEKLERACAPYIEEVAAKLQKFS